MRERMGRFPAGVVTLVVLAAAAAPLLAPPAARAFEPAEVLAIVGNEKKPSDFPGAGGVWMARQRTVEIDGVGNAKIDEHYLARVFDPDWGQRRFGDYTRYYWTQFTMPKTVRARIWHSRTDFVDLPIEAVTDSLSFYARGVPSLGYLRERHMHVPRLNPGDVVELHMKWDIRIPPWDYNVRWLEEVIGDEDPVVEQQLILIHPAAAESKEAVIGPDLASQIYSQGGMWHRRWLTGNLPALTPRLFETPWSRFPMERDTLSANTTRVLFTTFKTWSEAGTYFAPQWADAIGKRSPIMDAAISDILRKEKDPVPRVLAVEKYVQERIRTIPVPWSLLGMHPFDSGSVALDGAGTPRDKDCVLVSLLQLAGLDAVPVLVRARGGLWDESLPCLDQLDRFMARVRLPDGREIWCDPVGPETPLPPSRGLVIAASAAAPPDSGLIAFPGKETARHGESD
jgi:hypothetical protein